MESSKGFFRGSNGCGSKILTHQKDGFNTCGHFFSNLCFLRRFFFNLPKNGHLRCNWKEDFRIKRMWDWTHVLCQQWNSQFWYFTTLQSTVLTPKRRRTNGAWKVPNLPMGVVRPFQVGFEDHQQNHLFFPNGCGADFFSSTEPVENCVFFGWSIFSGDFFSDQIFKEMGSDPTEVVKLMKESWPMESLYGMMVLYGCVPETSV